MPQALEDGEPEKQRTSFCSLWMSAAASEAERVSSSMLATTLPSRSSLSSGVTCAHARLYCQGNPLLRQDMCQASPH